VKRILVVDDDPAIGRMLSIILQYEGHQATAVTSAHAALDHLRDSSVDVVLSELFLGSPVNGLQLCTVIHREWPRVRFFLGTRTEDLDPTVAQACHVEAVLIKPYHLADLRRLAGRATRTEGPGPEHHAATLKRPAPASMTSSPSALGQSHRFAWARAPRSRTPYSPLDLTGI
jgi:two-component system OmpR family response regulator